MSDRTRWIAAAALLLAMGLSGCNREARLKEEAARMTGGNPDLGPQLIRKYGCSSCHLIPGIEGARGMVGPPLNGIASRTYLGGQLPNTPQNMQRWRSMSKRSRTFSFLPVSGFTSWCQSM